MDKKNYLIAEDWLSKPNEIIAKMTPEEKIITSDMISLLGKINDKELKDSIMKENINRIEYTLPNGRKRETVISRGGTTHKIVAEKICDWEKVLAYAKEHNLEVPMTKPQVDYEKLENEVWFQEHIQDFIHYENKEVVSTSYNRIIRKDLKEGE